MTSESIVRMAMPRDEDGLMDLCKTLYGENALFSMSDDKVRYYLRRAFARDSAMIGVIGKPQHIEAAIFMLIGQFWYSHDKHLEELFNYVRPEHRKSKHAQALITWAKELSADTPLPLVIGVLSTERTAAKVRLYRRQLGDPIGAFFFYDTKHVAQGPAAGEQPADVFDK